MFVSAWYVHGSSGRIVQLNDGEGAGMFELQQMEEDAVPIKEPFGPREYIKIGERADIINQ
ncbi:hypothetical protein [Halalkalibacterium ligniniphilum]|uniref:hypothetical protein n=1 Tax=Halalkalibacterium ligniniphilum TaxID=1134413 RepID=UPI00034759DB|nr:hypothetical protein [Halalkalibacterium ligniniphilum]